MDLDDSWQVGLRPEKTKPMHVSSEIVLWVSERARKNGWQRCCFICDVNNAPFLPLSFDRFPPNFPRTHVQVVARDTWFHIPERFPLRGQIPRKTVFLGYFRVPCL